MLRPMPTDWRVHLASQKYLRTKQDQIHSKMIAAKARCSSHAVRSSAPRRLYRIPQLARNRLPFRNSYKPRSWRRSHVDIEESLLRTNKKLILRQQSVLINHQAVGSGHSSSGSTSSSTKSRATSPPPQPRLQIAVTARCWAYRRGRRVTAVHGHRQADTDEDIELERASSRGKKRRLAQTQAEEAPAEAGREREERCIREDSDVK